jgi:hypothetical protein
MLYNAALITPDWPNAPATLSQTPATGALQTDAYYTYDGDGKLVKSVVAGVTTLGLTQLEQSE